MDTSSASQDTEKKPGRVVRAADLFWEQILGPVRSGLEVLGRWVILTGQTGYWLVRRPFRWRDYVAALDFIGVKSLSIILLVGLFSGAAFSLQTVKFFRMFAMESYIGATVSTALCRELSPVLTALMVTARAGSAMATEIGSMRITEQIDALHTLAVNPVHYLVCPRVTAAILVTPVLTMVFTFAGIGGAYLVAVVMMHVDRGYFVTNTEYILDGYDITHGLIKAALFGLVISIVGCERGYHASGGARGVGVATTQAVVFSSVAILMLDYFVSDILIVIQS